MTFFDDQDGKKDVKIEKESDTEMDDAKTIRYASPKRENDIDDRETIAYAFPKRESEDEIDEKILRNQPSLQILIPRMSPKDPI